MGTLRLLSLEPGQLWRKPRPSSIDRMFEAALGPMAHRMTPHDYVKMLDELGDNGGMVPATTDCAESIRRWGRAARAKIDRQRLAVWRKHCARRAWRSRLPRGRARRHRVARRTAAVKATADPDGPEPRAPPTRDTQRGAP